MSEETLTGNDTDVSPNFRRNRPGTCCLCGRELPLTFHHLIPRKVHRRSYFQKNFSRDDLNRGIFICRTCHRGIHALYDEMTLARHFNTPERLRADPELARHFAWCARQKQR
jgi:5-methylcytosine-specific restriction endonuclease McrA